MKKRIFLTGGSGFVGKNVLEQLGDKYSFVAPSHKILDLSNTDAVNRFFAKSGHFDFVIHTAIVGGNRKVVNSGDIATENMRFFFNIVRNKKFFKKMIHLGSGIEYGKESPLVKVRELEFDKTIPQDNFGFYKYICGKYIESVDNILNLRLFGIFGKYEDSTIRFVSNAICKSILKMPITINRNVNFDYLYIDDFVKILDYFLNRTPKYRSYNVTPGKTIDLITIANMIRALSGSETPIKVELKGFSNSYTASNQRLLSEIGEFRFTDFNYALSDLYKWYWGIKRKLSRHDYLNDYFK